jgi:NAD(P)-dependent dehydrogenase (short-subunit alcohol dehydrogenase family)
MFMNTYQHRVAVITGAGSGIGRELARSLASRGARLAISDVNEAALAETKSLCGRAEVRTYRVDVASRQEVFAHAVDVKRDFGTAHYVFNNAGVTLFATFEHMTLEELDWLLGINLLGVVYGTKAFLPLLLAQKEGHIVNISSIFGIMGMPGQSAYSISKFGVRALTESLWHELKGTGVKATLVHPGGIRTNIDRAAPLGRSAGAYEKSLMMMAGRLLVTKPDRCALDIVEGVSRGRKRILTGKNARRAALLVRLLPTSYGVLLRRYGL